MDIKDADMDVDIKVPDAIRGFGALAQATRLEAFRLLVRCGTDGMAAGEIARSLNVPQNTMSTHLATLVNAGLLGLTAWLTPGFSIDGFWAALFGAIVVSLVGMFLSGLIDRD